MKIRHIVTILPILVLASCVNTTPVRDSVRRFIPCPDSSRVSLAIADAPSVKLRIVELPSYLDSSKIAVRKNGVEIAYDARNLWSEPLATSVTRVLAERLRMRVGSGNVDVYPFGPGGELGAEIRVEFDSFEGDSDGSVHAVGRFTIVRKDGKPQVYPFDGGGKWTLGDYSSLARALGNATDDLAGAIAGKL